MSPARFNQEHRIINGPRPAPLKINKESQIIHKSSSSSFSSNVSSSTISIAAPFVPAAAKQHQHQKNQPVIIYTHSPKVIHTQARDFMALVQKLTGLSRSNNEEPETVQETSEAANNKGLESERKNINVNRKAVGNDDNESSSVLTDENYGGGHGASGNGGGGGVDTVSPILNPSNTVYNPYFGDVPLFTPTAADFFCSPRPLYRYTDPANLASPSNIGNLASPSLLEFFKGLPEYSHEC